MADIEKNVPAANGTHNAYTVGAGPGGVPYTLGANPVQQGLYQGGNLGLRKIANPAPLGLFSFASTTLILSLVNVQADGVTTANVVVGMALFVGGLCQLLAGMWEFACGNAFGATAFSSYGGFWLSYGTILIPGSGVLSSYDNESELHSALGFFLAAWFIFTLLMTIGAMRSNMGLILLFVFLTLTFMLLMIGEYIVKVEIVKAGGALGIITAFIAYYCAAANLYTRESSFVSLPLMPIAKRD